MEGPRVDPRLPVHSSLAPLIAGGLAPRWHLFDFTLFDSRTGAHGVGCGGIRMGCCGRVPSLGNRSGSGVRGLPRPIRFYPVPQISLGNGRGCGVRRIHRRYRAGPRRGLPRNRGANRGCRQANRSSTDCPRRMAECDGEVRGRRRSQPWHLRRSRAAARARHHRSIGHARNCENRSPPLAVRSCCRTRHRARQTPLGGHMTRVLVLDIPGWLDSFDTEAEAHRQFDDVIRRVEDTVPLVRVMRAGRIAMNARGPARYYGSEAAAAAALRAAHPPRASALRMGCTRPHLPLKPLTPCSLFRQDSRRTFSHPCP
jgi:hypothetical protein